MVCKTVKSRKGGVRTLQGTEKSKSVTDKEYSQTSLYPMDIIKMVLCYKHFSIRKAKRFKISLVHKSVENDSNLRI